MKLYTKRLYIVSTPIGNLEDITLRALNTLKKSDIILCEDTRRSIKLLNYYKIKKKLISYHKFNEKKQLLIILNHINEGKILSLISDAGTPLFSDPGSILVNECIKRNIQIIPIPGVTSIVAAMSISGFEDKFLFYGFLPKNEKEIEKTLSELSSIKFAQVFFMPANKINKYLKKIKKYFDGRKIIIAREITKIHESIYRDTISNIDKLKIPNKGEITVVISEQINKVKNFDKEIIINKAKKFLKKYSLKDTVDLILETEKINKKKIYQICLEIKNEKNF